MSRVDRALLARPKRWARSQPWMMRALHDLGIRPFGHSTFVWFREGEACHTRVTLRNYFSSSYGIDHPVYLFSLYDVDGNRLAEWQRAPRVDETLVLESRELLRELGGGSAFEGSLAIEVNHRLLDPPRYLRANVDYYNDRGLITTVHDQGRLVRGVRRDVQSTVYVREDDQFQMGLVLQNAYRYKRTPRECMAEATIELANNLGENRRASISPFPACGMRLVNLAEIFPDASQFLGGRVGGLRIRSNIPMGRSIPVLHSRATGHFAVSHTTGDNDPSIYPRDLLNVELAPMDAWAPIWSSFVEEGDSFHTEFAIFNNWLPRGTYSLDVRLFDGEGSPLRVLRGVLTLDPEETKVLSMSEVVREAGGFLPFRGSIEARIAPRWDQAQLPGAGMLQVSTVWWHGGNASQSTNQSLWYANPSREIPTIFSPLLAPRRTRLFGRVIANRRYDTILSLINPSSEEVYETTSETQVIVAEATGASRLMRRLAIPPHGSTWVPLEELFPNLIEFLRDSNGISSVMILDPKVKLLGYLGVRDKTYGTIGIDHLFGG